MVIVNKLVIPLLLVVLIFLLFVGGPEHYSSRVYRDIWDLGHVALFAVLSVALYQLPFIECKKLFTQVIIVFSLAIFFAGLSEWLQSGTGRTAELIDVRRDLVGALIGTLVVFRKSDRCSKVFPVLVTIAFAWVIFELNPLAKTLVDEYNIYKTGTVLSNLESVFEDERWKGNSEHTLSADFVDEGVKSLKVIFNTDAYSGITLKYMHRDWREKNSLYISVYNPEENSLLLNVRINDFLHIENNRYNDRFNQEIILDQGWNYFNFSIDDIESAPKGRKTNLENMQSFGMFVMNLDEPKTIYIDNVYLK